MNKYKTTLIVRHRRENLKKCSLRGLEERLDCAFFSYPHPRLPPLDGYLLLSVEGPPLREEDCSCGLLLLDATWRYASVMAAQIPEVETLPHRSLPAHWRTAYPRRQGDCSDPARGLASVEALFIAYSILGRNTAGLLDRYHWKEHFLSLNSYL